MRVLIFGMGMFYLNRKKNIKDEIVAFIDNKVEESTVFEDKKALHPSKWQEVNFDIVLLMSVHHQEMKEQLIELGVEKDKIWLWFEYLSRPNPGRIDLYIHDRNHGERRILVFTETLYYNGGSMAAVYAVMALKKKGYDVWLAGGRESINDTFLSEVAQFGVNIAVIYDTPYLLERDLYWIESFDIVIVNVFQMLKCACDISCKRPVLWWLHEPDLSYGPILSRFPEYHDSMNLKNMHIVGVSDIAKDSFGHYFQNVNCGTMAYGIPDERIPSIKSIKKEKFIYAIIGHISYHKGQDIFLRAVELMGNDCFENIEFWIIGNITQKEYFEKISPVIQKQHNVKLLGSLNRREMRKAFSEIDVIVSTSRADTMSIVLTEGMMYGKICISSNSTGMARYIKDGENGFVFESENVEAAYKKMKWVFLHREELDNVRKMARLTYEKFFSMEAFGDRLEKELNETEKMVASFGEI